MPKYIDNKKFEKLIRDYRRNKAKHQDELMEMFRLLIQNIMDGFNFKVDKEDAMQDCYVLILKTLKNFNPDKGKAFNYMTTVIVNNLRLVYSKNKRYKEKIESYTQHKFGVTPSSIS